MVRLAGAGRLQTLRRARRTGRVVWTVPVAEGELLAGRDYTEPERRAAHRASACYGLDDGEFMLVRKGKKPYP